MTLSRDSFNKAEALHATALAYTRAVAANDDLGAETLWAQLSATNQEEVTYAIAVIAVGAVELIADSSGVTMNDVWDKLAGV